MTNLKKPHILFLLPHKWETYVRRPHLQACTEYAYCIFINSPITLKTLFNSPSLFFKHILNNTSRRVVINESSYLYNVFAPFPFRISFSSNIASYINRIVLKPQINRILNRHSCIRPITFIFYPQQAYQLDALDYTCLCYEVCDNYSNYPDNNVIKQQKLDEADKRLAQKADIVFAVSQPLVDKYNVICAGKAVLLPNTCEIGHFKKAVTRNLETPFDIDNIKNPIIGFIGNINNLFDFDFVYNVAEMKPEWNIVLIGAVNARNGLKNEPRWKCLLKLPNIYHLGYKTYALLPNYLKCIDVAFMAYKQITYVRCIDPNKTMQYLAAGKKVVSTPIPALNRYPLIKIANEPQSFIDKIQEFLSFTHEQEVQYKQESLRLVGENTVGIRAKQRIEVINHLACITKLKPLKY
jgi:hypothetical protein